MNLISLKNINCQTYSNKKLFGLCDNPHPAKDPAYIDEANGERWIAVVINEPEFDTTFTAVDHCISTRRINGEMDNRCDGILSYNTTVIFVELKERAGTGNDWVTTAEDQLKSSIEYFEKNVDSDDYSLKKAYISNNEHPKFKYTQIRRMEQFQIDTGYTLRIENRIILT
jgi:hypothetical protein